MNSFLDIEKNIQNNKIIYPEGKSSSVLSNNLVNKYELHQACYYNNFYEVKRILLKCNIDINVQNELGQTPLNIACKLGYFNIVQFLLYKNCLVNLSDNEENTPLHNACCMGHYNIVKILLEHNASTKLENKLGLLPLNYALMMKGESYQKIIELLLF